MSDRVLRLLVVLALIGDPSKSWLYGEIKAGRFPRPIKLGSRSSGWLESEVNAWLLSRVEESRGAGKSQPQSAAVPVPKVDRARFWDRPSRRFPQLGPTAVVGREVASVERSALAPAKTRWELPAHWLQSRAGLRVRCYAERSAVTESR